MNPAIVAPDAFDIVDVSVDKGLTPDQVGFKLSFLPCKFYIVYICNVLATLIDFRGMFLNRDFY